MHQLHNRKMKISKANLIAKLEENKAKHIKQL